MTAALATPLSAALAAVRRDIDEEAAAAGRDPSGILLIAVSKGFPSGRVRELMQAGQLDFGENRAQELSAKASEVGPGPHWHFVGRLQRNKVRQVLAAEPVVHSLDRVELAAEISRRAPGPVPVLAEVNLSGERQKGGVEPGELCRLVEAVLGMPGLDLIGLMTMARRTSDPELARPVFRELARLRRDLAARYSDRIHHLSMGMSQDYRVAVQEGATMVRVGEAVFGPRGHRQAAKAPGKPDRSGGSER